MILADEELRGKHQGETAWIVGRGASLRYLTAACFGAGPIITMNSSILVVQYLELENPMYAFQKDGCDKWEIPGHSCGSDFRIVYPRPEIPVILMRHGYSEHCLTMHPKRLFLDPVAAFGFDPAEMSVRIAVALALRVMQCSGIAFVCCDSLASNDPDFQRSYNPMTGETLLPPGSGHYGYVKPIVLDDVKSVPYQIVIPVST